MNSRLASTLLEKTIGRAFIKPFRLLYGGSPSVFLKRVGRLRRSAAAMVRAEPSPELPVRLQIETTDLCNFKCRMCTREVVNGMNTITMPLEKFEEVVDEINPYYVTMNGLGEPLIDKTIFEKLAFLHGRRITTSMPTNGTYIRRTKFERLIENLPDVLTFSIDGAKKESFESIRVLSDFDQVIANYQTLLAARERGEIRRKSKIKILCALQKTNLYDYRDMYSLLKSMRGIDEFNLVPVFDYDPHGNTFSHLVPTAEDVKKLHKELEKAVSTSQDSDEADFYTTWKRVSAVWLSREPEPRERTHNHACLVPWFSTYIDAKGRVYPCCYLTNTSHVMGNINQDSFRAIWAGDTYKDFRRALVTNRGELDGCRTCPRNDDGRLRQLNKFKRVLTLFSPR